MFQVAERDPFFPAYTSAETSNTYCPLGEQFFRSISGNIRSTFKCSETSHFPAFLMNGFMQSPSDELETFTIRLCRDVLCSLLYVFRPLKTIKQISSETAEDTCSTKNTQTHHVLSWLPTSRRFYRDVEVAFLCKLNFRTRLFRIDVFQNDDGLLR